MVADGGFSTPVAAVARPRTLSNALTALVVAAFLAFSYELFAGAMVWALCGLFGLPGWAVLALEGLVIVSALWIGWLLFRRTINIDVAPG